jgi:uncharacterized membrane protein YqjE
VAAEGGASLPGLARVMQGMVTVHLEFAQREARADLSRVIGAVLLALVAGALGFFALGLGHVAAVLLLQARSSYDLLTSTGLVAGVDLALAALLALVARARLSRPMLPDTRAMVKRTLGAFAD